LSINVGRQYAGHLAIFPKTIKDWVGCPTRWIVGAGGGGFGFGGSAPVPVDDQAATAAGGGFGFGSALAPAGGTPVTPTAGGGKAAPATPSTPAPVDMPQTAHKTTAGGEPSPVATPTTINTLNNRPPAEPPALEYQTLMVKQILNKFRKELESDAVAYMEQAKRVCEYDAVLRDSQRDLAHLTHQTLRLLLEQEHTEQTLLGIGAFQYPNESVDPSGSPSNVPMLIVEPSTSAR